MKYYSTCANCGANLDPGERCDCMKGMDNPSRDFTTGKEYFLFQINQRLIGIETALKAIAKAVTPITPDATITDALTTISDLMFDAEEARKEQAQ